MSRSSLPEEARILDAYAWLPLALRRTDEARDHFVESLQAYEEVGSVRGIGLALLGLGATAAVEGNLRRAVRVPTAAEVFSAEKGVANVFVEGSPAAPYLEAARERIEADELARLKTEGQRYSVRDAVRFALEEGTPHDTPSPPTSVP